MTKKLKFLIKELMLLSKVADKENEQAYNFVVKENEQAYNFVVKELMKEIDKGGAK